MINYCYYKILHYFRPKFSSMNVINILIFILYRGNFSTEKEFITPEYTISFDCFYKDNSSYSSSHCAVNVLQKKEPFQKSLVHIHKEFSLFIGMKVIWRGIMST